MTYHTRLFHRATPYVSSDRIGSEAEVGHGHPTDQGVLVQDEFNEFGLLLRRGELFRSIGFARGRWAFRALERNHDMFFFTSLSMQIGLVP